MNFFEYDWEGFKPDVKDSVNERDVEVEEENNWLQKAELKRAN